MDKEEKDKNISQENTSEEKTETILSEKNGSKEILGEDKKETIQSTQSELAPQVKIKEENFFLELVKFVFIILVVLVPFRLYIAQPFIVNGTSMSPTFETGQYLIVDEISYRFEEPQRGDVIIFKKPHESGEFLIKRLIGLPGETVEIRGKDITIKNTSNPNGFKLNEPYIKFNRDEVFTRKLLDDEYFVMGDNRPVSLDSRIIGPIKSENIVGKAFLRLLPVTKADVMPGDYK